MRLEPTFAKLIRSFLFGDTVNGEATLDVVQDAEVLAGFLNRDDV
jgi:hypothetical protein